MRLKFEQLTATGDRKSNQDFMSHIVNSDYALFVVADGLGGHQAGERASGYFCKGLIKTAPEFTKEIYKKPETVLGDWIDAAINEMGEMFGDDPVATRAHTTCAILFIQDEVVMTAHCGDSRIYRMTADEILWRTRDHSVTQRLFDEGEVSEREMGVHPEQNQLTKSINVLRTYAPEIIRHPAIIDGETFLLCTDGFWEYIKPNELLKMAKTEYDRKALVKQAKTAYLRAQGNCDNLTVQWVRVVESSR